MKSGTFRFMTRPRPHLPAHLSACPLFQRFAERCAYNSTHPHGPTQLTLKHSYMPPLNLLSSSFLDKMPPSRLPAPAYFFSILRERRDDLSELRQSTALEQLNLAFERNKVKRRIREALRKKKLMLEETLKENKKQINLAIIYQKKEIFRLWLF